MSDTYTYALTTSGMIRRSDGAIIPPDPANRDYQAFLEWQAAGNTPTPAPVAPPAVVLPRPTTLEADPEGNMDATTRRYVDEQIATVEQEIQSRR